MTSHGGTSYFFLAGGHFHYVKCNVYAHCSGNDQTYINYNRTKSVQAHCFCCNDDVGPSKSKGKHWRVQTQCALIDHQRDLSGPPEHL